MRSSLHKRILAPAACLLLRLCGRAGAVWRRRNSPPLTLASLPGVAASGQRTWMMRGYALGVGAGTRVFSHIPWFLLPAMQGEMARTLCMSAGWTVNLAVTQWLSGPALVNTGPTAALPALAVRRDARACLPFAAVVSTMLAFGWVPLLPAMLIGSPAGAATIEIPGLDLPARAAPAAAPCYRARCIDLAAVGQRGTGTPAVVAKPGASAGAAHLPARGQAEAYDCLLGVGFGGELRSHGYQGFKALGRTWTLKRAGVEAP